MRGIVVAMCAAALAACGSQASSSAEADQPAVAAPEPDAPPQASAAPALSSCPARDPVDEGLRQRTAPIPIPAAMRQTMRSDMDNLAFATLDGATVCVDASWMESIRDLELSPDRRFASFGWDGYESYGHVIVDRAGRGQVIDTGTPPVASPSGKLLAAADLSESGFGALNAFAVWRIEPAEIRLLASANEVPEATDWRIDGWAGEACIDLNAVPWDSSAEAGDARERYHARQDRDWRIEPGRCADA